MLKPIPLDSLQIPLEKTNLIEAAAGTGKTYTIQNLTVRLLLEKRVPIESMVILSFTNKAADELSERILRVLNNALAFLKGSGSDRQAKELIEHDRMINSHIGDDERIKVIKTALRDFDLAQISTINGFFQRILSEYAFESGVLFNVALETNSGERLKQLYWNWFRRRFYNHPFQELLIGFLGNENELIRRAVRFADEQTLVLAREAQTLESVLKEMQKIFRQLLENYDRDMVASISGMLYSNRAKKLELFLQELDRGILSAKLHKLLVDFTPESLEKVTLKDYREKMQEIFITQPFFDLCAELAEYGSRLSHAVISDALFELRTSFDAAKKMENFMTYNDQNTRVDQALQAPDGVLAKFLRDKFKVGIIDEFQDTNGAQYRIFNTLFAPEPGESDRCCFLVGDPRQAIYRFRGGDLFVYFQARDAADNIYYLDRNFRSSPDLVAAVNKLFAEHPSPFGDENLSFPPLQAQAAEKCPDMIDCREQEKTLPPLRLNMCHNSDVILARCASRISQLLAPECKERVYDEKISAFRPVGCNDIVVLVRSHWRAEEMRHQLLELDIPAMCLRTGSVYGTREAAELCQVLYALHNSSDRRAVNGALLTGICGMTLEELSSCHPGSIDREILPEELDKFYRCAASWREEGFEVMFDQLLQSFNVKSRFAALPNGERKLVNLLQLQQLLQQLNVDGGMSPESLLAAFSYNIVNSSDQDESQSEMLVSDHPVVRIMTIHASKGLGFPIVMLPDLQQFNWEKNADFLCHNQEKSLVLNAFDDLELKNQCIREEHQEHLRLLYVAVTRAKYRCEIFMDKEFKKLNALDYMLAPGSYGIDDVKRQGELTIKVDLPQYDFWHATSFSYSGGYEKYNTLTAPPEVDTVHPEWRIVSYSFLSRDAQAQGVPVDRDAETAADENVFLPLPESGFSPFKLPGGNLFGTALHEIFEKSDFGASPEEFRQETERVFRSYGISCGGGELYEKMVSECGNWLYNICHTQLADADGNGFTLAQIKANERKNEMEFYFGLGDFDLYQVVEAVDEYVRSNELQLQSWPENWQSELHGGILNGFIDLVFRWQGRYYIIDWKSNRLGGDIRNFSPEKLKPAMVESFYFFQYLLYTVALVRHLRRFNGNVFGEAEYEKLFGGVYYLFVRGMVPEYPGYGVFRARPPWQVISALEQVLCGKMS